MVCMEDLVSCRMHKVWWVSVLQLKIIISWWTSLSYWWIDDWLMRYGRLTRWVLISGWCWSCAAAIWIPISFYLTLYIIFELLTIWIRFPCSAFSIQFHFSIITNNLLVIEIYLLIWCKWKWFVWRIWFRAECIKFDGCQYYN